MSFPTLTSPHRLTRRNLDEEADKVRPTPVRALPARSSASWSAAPAAAYRFGPTEATTVWPDRLAGPYRNQERRQPGRIVFPGAPVLENESIIGAALANVPAWIWGRDRPQPLLRHPGTLRRVHRHL